MKEAYKKAVQVVDSCMTSVHTLGAYNYIWNFSKLFSSTKGCKELTRKLHAKCSNKRKTVETK